MAGKYESGVLEMIWPSPNPQSILGGMMGLMMIGCVSIPTHEKGKHDAYIEGLTEARDIAISQGCDDVQWLIQAKIDLEKNRNEIHGLVKQVWRMEKV